MNKDTVVVAHFTPSMVGGYKEKRKRAVM